MSASMHSSPSQSRNLIVPEYTSPAGSTARVCPVYRASPRLGSAVIRDISFGLYAKARIVRLTGVVTSGCAAGAGSPVQSAIIPNRVHSVAPSANQPLVALKTFLGILTLVTRVCQFPASPHLAAERSQVLRSMEKVSLCDVTWESTPAPKVCYREATARASIVFGTVTG